MAVLTGLDGILGYLGTPHPCITVHLLLTLGMLVLGLGSPEVSTLLPLPLYSCWGGLTIYDLSKGFCTGATLLPETSRDDERQILECSATKWQPLSFPGAVLVGMRVLVAIIAGISMDVFGRRRSVVAWMGLYFVVAFARTFSPNSESVVFCVTLEGTAAQAATLGLLLLATEGSTQQEGVRSACLVLLGHAVGVGAGVPLLKKYIPELVYNQMARSLPSLVFVLFIITLPESARWAVCRGAVQEATVMLKKSHHMAFDPTLRPKLTAIYEEHRASLSQHKCCGHAFRESVQSIVKNPRLLLVCFVFSVSSFTLGCAASARNLFDPTAYHSFEDRQVAFGSVEFLGLLVMGLVMSRLSVKKVLVSLKTILSLALLLTPLLKEVGIENCVGNVFVSCLGHLSLVLTIVWMGVGIIRLTPTHSRGAVLGMSFALATLGHSVPYMNFKLIILKLGYYLDTYSEVGMWAILTFIGGLLTLALPKTNYCLPDTLSHMKQQIIEEERSEDVEETQNTPL